MGLILVGLVMLGGGIALVVYLARRIPRDWADICAKHDAFKTRKYPAVLAKMETEEVRQRYQQKCALEFPGIVIASVVTWGVLFAAIVAAFVAGALIFRAGAWGTFNW